MTKISFFKTFFLYKTKSFASKALLKNLSPRPPKLGALGLKCAFLHPLSCTTCALHKHDMLCHEESWRDMTCNVRSCHVMNHAVLHFRPINRPETWMKWMWYGDFSKVIFIQKELPEEKNKSAVWIHNVFYSYLRFTEPSKVLQFNRRREHRHCFQRDRGWKIHFIVLLKRSSHLLVGVPIHHLVRGRLELHTPLKNLQCVDVKNGKWEVCDATCCVQFTFLEDFNRRYKVLFLWMINL